MAPLVFEGSNLDAKIIEPLQLVRVVTFVDFQGEVVERRCTSINGAAALAERVRQRRLKQTDNLCMASMTACDAEKRNPVKLAKNIEADDFCVELLDRLQIFDPQDSLTDSFDSRIHGIVPQPTEHGFCVRVEGARRLEKILWRIIAVSGGITSELTGRGDYIQPSFQSIKS